MSRTIFHPRALLSTATLAAMLLATACSDPTTPSDGDGNAAGTSPTPAPVASDGQFPTPDAGEAPEITRRVPGDTSASSAGPNFLLQSASQGTQWAPSPGWVRIPQGAAACTWLPTVPESRYIHVSGIKVGITGGRSAYFDQYVTADVRFYRSNGRAWVYQGGAQAEASLPHFGSGPMAYNTLSQVLFPVSTGSYTVVIRFTWWAKVAAGWVQTAWTTFDFTTSAEYQAGLGATTGPGYCTLNL